MHRLGSNFENINNNFSLLKSSDTAGRKSLIGKDENDNELTQLMQFTPLLLNNEVLPKIFKHLPFESILACRQVCPSWNTIICSTPIFSKRLVVTIRHSIDSILSLFLSSQHQTFSSFRFITETMNNSTTIQIDFWNNFGPTLKSLELIHHTLGPVTFLEVLLSCPNLKELVFNCAPIYSSQHNFLGNGNNTLGLSFIDGQQVYQKLIPNLNFMQKTGILESLECLYVKDSNSMPAGILVDLLQWGGSKLKCLSLTDDASIESMMRANGRSHPNSQQAFFPSWDIRHVLYLVEDRAKILVQLELSGLHIHPEHIYLLAKLKYLRLRILKLKFVQLDTPSLISLFRRQKYLEELDLSYTAGVSEKAFTNTSCTFYKLKKLCLAGYTSSLDFFSFLSRMPNLIELNLSNSRSHSMTWDTLIHSFLPIKLRKLSRLDLSFNLALGSLKRQSLFQSFINCFKSSLTCLNLSCSTGIRNNYLQILWKDLPKMRILYLETVPNITDEGITGIRQSQLYGNELNDSMDLSYSSQLLRKHNNGTYHIGYCTNLEVLSLSSNPKLTDFIIQFGLRFLGNLKKLKLSGCSKLTDRSLFLLLGSCPLLEYIDLRGCPKLTLPWINWANTTLPHLKLILEPRKQYFQQLRQDQQQTFFQRLQEETNSISRNYNQDQQKAQPTPVHYVNKTKLPPPHETQQMLKDQGTNCEERFYDELAEADDKFDNGNETDESASQNSQYFTQGIHYPQPRSRKRTRQQRANPKTYNISKVNTKLKERLKHNYGYGHQFNPVTASTPTATAIRETFDYNTEDGEFRLSIIDENNNDLQIPRQRRN